MTTEHTTNDVATARRDLRHSIDQLAEQRRHRHNSISVLDELRSVIPGVQGTGNRGVARSMPAIWCDPFDLLTEIDHVTAQWCGAAGTIETRLQTLTDKGWTPHNIAQLHAVTAAINAWTRRALVLLEPGHVKTISAPCPVSGCGATHVYRRDAAGDAVRQPALQVIADRGCTCLACGTHWAPEYFLHLCGVLGFDLPEGVLE